MRLIPVQPTEFIKGKQYYFKEDDAKFSGYFAYGKRMLVFTRVRPYEPMITSLRPDLRVYELIKTKEELYKKLEKYLDDVYTEIDFFDYIKTDNIVKEVKVKKNKRKNTYNLDTDKEYIIVNGNDEYTIVTYNPEFENFDVVEFVMLRFDKNFLQFYEPDARKNISRRIFESKTRIGDEATLNYLTSFLGGKTHRKKNNARRSTRRTNKLYQ